MTKPPSSRRCLPAALVLTALHASVMLTVLWEGRAAGLDQVASATPAPVEGETASPAPVSSDRDVVDWLAVTASIVGAAGTAVAAWAAHKATRAASSAIDLAREANDSSRRQATAAERAARVSLMESASASLTKSRTLLQQMRATIHPDTLSSETIEPLVQETRDMILKSSFYLTLLDVNAAASLRAMDRVLCNQYRIPSCPPEFAADCFREPFRGAYFGADDVDGLFEPFADVATIRLWDDILPDSRWAFWLELAMLLVGDVQGTVYRIAQDLNAFAEEQGR